MAQVGGQQRQSSFGRDHRRLRRRRAIGDHADSPAGMRREYAMVEHCDYALLRGSTSEYRRLCPALGSLHPDAVKSAGRRRQWVGEFPLKALKCSTASLNLGKSRPQAYPPQDPKSAKVTHYFQVTASKYSTAYRRFMHIGCRVATPFFAAPSVPSRLAAPLKLLTVGLDPRDEPDHA